MSERTFGPTALLTPANLLTFFRLLVAPVFIVLVIHHRVSWMTAIVGLLAPFTDYFDGKVARAQGTTTAGAFLDPLADKLIVLGGFGALVIARDPVRAMLWPGLVIAVREVWMSLYRTRASRHGISIPATSLAKWKTFAQDLAIGLCVLPGVGTHPLISIILAWGAAVLTVITGWQYYRDGRQAGLRAR